jgi:hypothetical protein
MTPIVSEFRTTLYMNTLSLLASFIHSNRCTNVDCWIIIKQTVNWDDQQEHLYWAKPSGRLRFGSSHLVQYLEGF